MKVRTRRQRKSGSSPREWGMLRRMLNKRIGASPVKPEPDWLRGGFLMGSDALSPTVPVRNHWELRKRPPLQKKKI